MVSFPSSLLFFFSLVYRSPAWSDKDRSRAFIKMHTIASVVARGDAELSEEFRKKALVTIPEEKRVTIAT